MVQSIYKKNLKKVIYPFVLTCLVCPERWGRPLDIEMYKKIMLDLYFNVDAVMTGKIYAKIWTE